MQLSLVLLTIIIRLVGAIGYYTWKTMNFVEYKTVGPLYDNNYFDFNLCAKDPS